MSLRDLGEMRWENKVPHEVGRLNEDGDLVELLPKSRFAIRVNQRFRPKFRVDGTIIGRFEGPPDFKNLPNPIREDTMYVVSGITATLMRRWNFVSPRSDSAGLDRLADKSITSTRSFVTFGELPE